MLRAFTLMELIIGLIISSIVVIMAGAVFNIATKQFGEYKKTNEKLKDWSTLSSLLQTDVDQSVSLKMADENSLKVFYPDRTIVYERKDDRVLRVIGNVTDTFRVRTDKFGLSFMDNIQLKKEGLVDKVSFQLKYDEEAYNCCFRKKYSSRALMQEETEK